MITKRLTAAFVAFTVGFVLSAAAGAQDGEEWPWRGEASNPRQLVRAFMEDRAIGYQTSHESGFRKIGPYRTDEFGEGTIRYRMRYKRAIVLNDSERLRHIDFVIRDGREVLFPRFVKGAPYRSHSFDIANWLNQIADGRQSDR